MRDKIYRIFSKILFSMVQMYRGIEDSGYNLVYILVCIAHSFFGKKMHLILNPGRFDNRSVL